MSVNTVEDALLNMELLTDISKLKVSVNISWPFDYSTVDSRYLNLAYLE